MEIRKIGRSAAVDFLKCFHYLRNVKSGSVCYGIFDNKNSILGVVCFYGSELSRFALVEGLPKNSASKLLSFSCRQFFTDFPDIKKIYSFADDFQGHTGGIYKACGWTLVEERKSVVFVADVENSDFEDERNSYSGKYCLEKAYSDGVRSGKLVMSKKLKFEKAQNK
jgi:hypothetical protein